jgi:hypothetical protein
MLVCRILSEYFLSVAYKKSGYADLGRQDCLLSGIEETHGARICSPPLSDMPPQALGYIGIA